MYVVSGSDGPCIVAVRLIVGVRYLERPLMEVLLYNNIYIYIYIYIYMYIYIYVYIYIPTAKSLS